MDSTSSLPIAQVGGWLASATHTRRVAWQDKPRDLADWVSLLQICETARQSTVAFARRYPEKGVFFPTISK